MTSAVTSLLVDSDCSTKFSSQEDESFRNDVDCRRSTQHHLRKTVLVD